MIDLFSRMEVLCMNLESIKTIIKKNIITFFSVLLTLISIIGSLCYAHFYKCEECKSDETPISNTLSFASEEKEEQNYVKVDVKGAVKKTGVYSLVEGSTVSDAIEASGGLTANGVTTNINLSKKIKDEMVIYVFNKNELKEKETTKGIVCEVPKCECETVAVDKDICSNDNETTITSNKLISINTDSVEELMSLDGIGETKAKAIIQYRKDNGNFTKIEDLMNVSGIGEKAFNSIKDKIIV